ncbi:Uncharacterized protein HZ326_26660 [Fusarium oxysporum f. sp. albedinis]|nr:Uncharacterized protein HZ326_26660 [Fusarium oxysporum f. sp. albedinis]
MRSYCQYRSPEDGTSGTCRLTLVDTLCAIPHAQAIIISHFDLLHFVDRLDLNSTYIQYSRHFRISTGSPNQMKETTLEYR